MIEISSSLDPRRDYSRHLTYRGAHQESLLGESICLRLHSDVVFDLFVETHLMPLVALLSNFSKYF